jgi:putative acetyltransferase
MKVRGSTREDLNHIQTLHLKAFGESEGKAVSELAVALASDERNLSLVAIEGTDLLGHIVFSPVSVSCGEQYSVYILSPLAIVESHQNKGLGRLLIQAGLERLSEQSADGVLVYGDPKYYGRYGFHTDHSIAPPYELLYPEAWQALALNDGRLDGCTGKASCVPELMKPELW